MYRPSRTNLLVLIPKTSFAAVLFHYFPKHVDSVNANVKNRNTYIHLQVTDMLLLIIHEYPDFLIRHRYYSYKPSSLTIPESAPFSQ